MRPVVLQQSQDSWTLLILINSHCARNADSITNVPQPWRPLLNNLSSLCTDITLEWFKSKVIFLIYLLDPFSVRSPSVTIQEHFLITDINNYKQHVRHLFPFGAKISWIGAVSSCAGTHWLVTLHAGLSCRFPTTHPVVGTDQKQNWSEKNDALTDISLMRTTHINKGHIYIACI